MGSEMCIRDRHTGRWFGHIVCLLSVQTGGACAIATRRPDSAGLAARALLIRLSARCTDVAQSADTRVAHRTVLARLLICRRLGSRSTLTAYPALASPPRRTRLACRHVVIGLSATAASSTGAIGSGEAIRAGHAYRATRVRLGAWRTRLADATRASKSRCTWQALCAGCTRLISHAAQHAAATGASCPGSATHTRCPVIVWFIAIAACGARPV